MRTLAAALLALTALSASAEAQRLPTRRIVSRGWPTAAAAAPAAQPSDARAEAAPVVTQTSDDTPAPAPEPAAVPAPAAAASTLHVFGRTGLRVTLPAGWDGPTAADESRLPASALYTFTSSAPGPLAGATLRIDQVVGLNPAEEQQWRSGQTRVGYHGSRPVGPASVPVEALVAFETAGAGTGGAVAFLQRGRTFWAVSVEAPVALWRSRRADVLALMAGVSVPTVAAGR